MAYSVRSLLLHAEMRSPMVSKDVYWLRQQRGLLGEGRFGPKLRALVGDQTANQILETLDQVATEYSVPHPGQASGPRRRGWWRRRRHPGSP